MGLLASSRGCCQSFIRFSVDDDTGARHLGRAAGHYSETDDDSDYDDDDDDDHDDDDDAGQAALFAVCQRRHAPASQLAKRHLSSF